MKTEDIKKMGLAYVQVLEAKKVNKHGHDAVGHEDPDIDNDGDTDKSDEYLHNRRKAIKANMKSEALVGNQHKIDANKNGKVDAHDFHLLRKGKKVQKEETEIDEAGMPSSVIKSKQKYAGMSDKDFAAAHGHKSAEELKSMARRHGYGQNSNEYINKVSRGSASANTKNEEVEQVDEISKALLRKVGGKMLRKGLSDDPKAAKHMKSANLASAKLYPDQYKNSPLKAKVPATESTEWPVFKRIQEKSDKFTVKYSVSGVGDDPHQIDMKFADPNHVKGATKPEKMGDTMSAGERDFVDQHGGLEGTDSGIHGHKAAAHTAKAAVADVKAAPGRHNDSKIGDKTMSKPKG